MLSWHERVKKVKEWIDENAERDISLSELSSLFGYSSFYLSRKFHQLQGVTLKKYILTSKLQHSAARLNETDDRIIDIAFSHGYSSQEAFTRAFIKLYGTTPWAYRSLQKPSPAARKSRLLRSVGFTTPIGGNDMKIYVKQMYDWNYYAYFAEDVDEKYWGYFKDDLWWQIGNSFTKSFDNVKDFEYCAENFTKYGEISIKQQLKMIPAPWQKALDLFAFEMDKLGAGWYVHGSTAMALWGIDVKPKDVDIIIPNISDFDRVRDHFCKLAIRPIERCDNWLMSGLGRLFMEATVGIAFHNPQPQPFDMSKLGKAVHCGREIYIESLEELKRDNENFGRPQRVKAIEDRINAIRG